MFKRFQEQSFRADTEKKVVYVYINGQFTDVNVDGKTMSLELNWTLEAILSTASQRLNVSTAKRLFNADGIEINDAMMIQDEDMLFLSNGEEFVPKPYDYKKPNAAGIGQDDDVTSGNEAQTRDPFAMSGGINDQFAAKSDNLPPIIGNYKVSTFLGRGGFGVVRVGKHQLTEERVALKFINKSDILSIAAAERTMTEIQCLTTLKHNNIILLYEYVETPNHVVLMFELMNGGDLSSYLKHLTVAQGVSNSDGDEASEHEAVGVEHLAALPEEDARTVFYQIVSAVSFAHNHHICHRDLKLENILLKNKSSVEIVKVADFGLSDFYRPGSVRKSSCGTLAFLAPEGFKNTANAGPPLDVWSLGVILFALLIGRLPFDDDIERNAGAEKELSAMATRTGTGLGRYDLEERDKDYALRENGRSLYNIKDVYAGTERSKRHSSKGQLSQQQQQQLQQQQLHQQQHQDEEEESKEAARARKAPRPEHVIRSKILRCQYSFDPSTRGGGGTRASTPPKPVSIEAKDLIRRMLVLDPEERASVPDIFSHIWTRNGVRNHHNHSTPRANEGQKKPDRRREGKEGKEGKVRSLSDADSRHDSSDDGGNKEESYAADLPVPEPVPAPAPVMSPLIRTAPHALTRQASSEFYELERADRDEGDSAKHTTSEKSAEADSDSVIGISRNSSANSRDGGNISDGRGNIHGGSRGGRRVSDDSLPESSSSAPAGVGGLDQQMQFLHSSSVGDSLDTLGAAVAQSDSGKHTNSRHHSVPNLSAAMPLSPRSPTVSSRHTSFKLAGASTIGLGSGGSAAGSAPGSAGSSGKENPPTAEVSGVSSGSMLMPLRRAPTRAYETDDESFSAKYFSDAGNAAANNGANDTGKERSGTKPHIRVDDSLALLAIKYKSTSK